MRLRLPADQTHFLADALRKAADKEIGGQLYGEQLALSDFRITKVVLQKRPGTFVRFFIDLVQAAEDALQFFNHTKHNYTRFNYIGEWHSHPNFGVYPSGTDITTMRGLVADPDFYGNFAILLITRLQHNGLTAGAWLFDPSGIEQRVNLEFEI